MSRRQQKSNEWPAPSSGESPICRPAFATLAIDALFGSRDWYQSACGASAVRRNQQHWNVLSLTDAGICRRTAIDSSRRVNFLSAVVFGEPWNLLTCIGDPNGEDLRGDSNLKKCTLARAQICVNLNRCRCGDLYY
jgi:hypothetical protein